MNAAEIQLLIADAMRRRERLVEQRAVQSDAAETFRAQACEPGHSPEDRREFRFKEIHAHATCQRFDNALWEVDGELRKLRRDLASAEAKADVKAEHDEFFNRVRQVVATSNVVALPFPTDHTPEAA